MRLENWAVVIIIIKVITFWIRREVRQRVLFGGWLIRRLIIGIVVRLGIQRVVCIIALAWMVERITLVVFWVRLAEI